MRVGLSAPTDRFLHFSDIADVANSVAIGEIAEVAQAIVEGRF
jgi:hypothetical protein